MKKAQITPDKPVKNQGVSGASLLNAPTQAALERRPITNSEIITGSPIKQTQAK